MTAGILFDMDGVLFDTERLAKKGWQLAAEQLGLEVTEDFLSRLRGTNLRMRKMSHKTAGSGAEYAKICEKDMLW